MLLAAALALGLFARSPSTPGVATATRASTYRVGPWRLRVVRDEFARSTTCRLSVHGAEVSHGRLLWRLGSGVDTSAAIWRIDAGEPRRQSLLDLPASANLVNPSDGRLSAPVTLLSGARALEARPTPRSRVRRLGVEGLDAGLAAAAAQGCANL